MALDLKPSLHCLKNGGVIIYPTESCYGLGCDARNKMAVAKIHQIKREEPKPLTILVSDLGQVQQFGVLNKTAMVLSSKFHPGQLNLIIAKKIGMDLNYLSTNGIAFRIPGHPFLLELLKRFGSAITTTSANIHGQPPLHDIASVRAQFGSHVCAIVDSGDLEPSIPVSATYDTRTNHLIRAGSISIEKIRNELK